MKECIHCNHCVFREKCTPIEKLLQNEDDEECTLFIDINNFYSTNLEEQGEYFWIEMSWHRFTDNCILV